MEMGFGGGVVLAFWCCDKVPEKDQLEDSFWFTGSEGSVHGQRAPLPLGCNEAETF